MSQSVNLPALGESVTEGTVTRWLKNVGDRVEVDEPLVEVSTDKVDTEIPSPIAGVVEAILVHEDETVEVGTALVTIGDGAAPSGDVPAEPSSAEARPEEPAPEEPAPEGTDSTSAESAAASQDAAAEAQPETVVPSPEAPAPQEAQATSTQPPAPATNIDEPPTQEAPTQEAQQESPQQASAAPQYLPSVAPPAAEAPSSDQAPTEQAPDEQAPDEQALDEQASAEQATSAEATTEQPQATAPVQATSTPAAPQQVSSALPPQAEETSAQVSAQQEASGNAGYVTPLVRKLANEKGIDLSTVNGTGVGGRIRKQDLEMSPGTATTSADQAGAAGSAKTEISPLRGTTAPMSRLRKVIAERAVASMQASAQLTTVVEADVTRVANLRDRVKADFLSKTGTKLSFLPFFALVAAEALKSFPVVNATIDGDSIVYPAQENVSIAVDTERGLLTPVIRDASSLDIAGLAKEIADLATRTRDNELKPDELAGGTFTLTNTGSRGALFDTPVVFLPQSAILGTGVVTKRPVVVSADGTDSIAVRSMVYLALSYDHRIVDGADASRFLVQIKNRLEEGDFEASLGI